LKLQYKNNYINYDIRLNQVYDADAVSKEIEGPGSRLGYRAITQKVGEMHSLNVPQDIVYEVMKDIDPDGLARQDGVGISKKKKETNCISGI